MDSPLQPELQAQLGAKKKTHRGRRSKGKGARGTAPNHMQEANAHIKAAHTDPTPRGTTAHLFRALSSLKKAQKSGPNEGQPAEMP